MIGNWTSATILTCRNTLSPSPLRLPLSNLPMLGVGSHMYMIVTLLQRVFDAKAQLYIMNVCRVNHRLRLLFGPRHVPPTPEGMQELSVSPPLPSLQHPGPQSSPHGSGSLLANRKYRPSCPSKLQNPLKTPSLATNQHKKIICGCFSTHETRVDLVAKTASTS